MSTLPFLATRPGGCIRAISHVSRRSIVRNALTARDVYGRLLSVSRGAWIIALLSWLLVSRTSMASLATTQLLISPAVQFSVVDEAVQIDVLVVDAYEVFAGQFTLRFDAEIIQVLEVEPGPLLEGTTPIIRVDEESGTVLYAASLTSPAAPVTGSGPLATLTLLGLTEGSTVLLLEGALSDVNGGYLPASVRGGTFNVTAEPVPESARPPTATEPPSNPPVGEPSTTATEPIQESADPTESPVPPTVVPPSATTALSPQSATPTIGSLSQTALPPLAPTPTAGPAATQGTESAASPTAVLAGPTSTVLAQVSATDVSAPVTATPAGNLDAAVPPASEEEEAMAGALSSGLFLTLLSILLLGTGALGIVVLLSIWTWYQGGRQ